MGQSSSLPTRHSIEPRDRVSVKITGFYLLLTIEAKMLVQI